MKRLPGPVEEPPLEIEMRRAPWWAGGRFREVRRRFPRHFYDLPLWARLGFMTPFETPTLLWLVSIGCAAGAAVLIAVLYLFNQQLGL